jgi:hypothetical protein
MARSSKEKHRVNKKTKTIAPQRKIGHTIALRKVQPKTGLNMNERRAHRK